LDAALHVLAAGMDGDLARAGDVLHSALL
jgi:hypothetical protein